MSLIDSIIKFAGLFICSAYVFAKTINKSKTSFWTKLIIFVFAIILSSLQYLLINHSTILFRIILISFIQSLLYSKIIQKAKRNAYVEKRKHTGA